MANRPDEASPFKRSDSRPLDASGESAGSSAPETPAGSAPQSGTPEPAKTEAASTEGVPPSPSIIPVPKPAEGAVARVHDVGTASESVAAESSVPPVQPPEEHHSSSESAPSVSAPETEPGISGTTIHDEPGASEHHDEWQHPDSNPDPNDPYHHHEEYQHHSHHEPGAYAVSSALVPAGGGSGGGGSDTGSESSSDDNGEGGPVKSFLDHLEDLRWMMIKCSAIIGVATLGCLLAGNWITGLLSYPLRKSELIPERLHQSTNVVVNVNFGTNVFGPYRVKPEVLGSLAVTNERYVTITMKMVQVGTNNVLALESRKMEENEHRTSTHLEVLTPAGGFLIAFKVAIYAGILISSPFLLWFIGQFVFPALKVKEKKFISRAIFIGSFLFLCGVAFCYFLLMPVALNASVAYSEWLGFEANQWRAEEYISFVCKFMLGMGLGFEMPVVILTLVRIGLVDYATLVKLRPYMVVINLVLGAVLTTPEVLTQVLMAVPLQILFEISVLITWNWERKARKREAAEAAAGK